MDHLTLYTDGASRGNPGPAAAAWLILRGTEILESEVRVLGTQTNNFAEYTALASGLSAVKKYGDTAAIELEVFSDSELMISQMNGVYAIRSTALKPLHADAARQASQYANVVYTHVPRENAYIGACDWLCNDALNTLKAAKAAAEQKTAEIRCEPIGIVSSPFRERSDAPNQGKNTRELSKILIHPAYRDGLLGLSAGDSVFILCWFDRAERDILQVCPRGRTEPSQQVSNTNMQMVCPRGRTEPRLSGVFATRAPVRPNPISLTLVKILKIDGTTLTVQGLEALDATPVLDIKPYYSGIDTPES